MDYQKLNCLFYNILNIRYKLGILSFEIYRKIKLDDY